MRGQPTHKCRFSRCTSRGVCRIPCWLAGHPEPAAAQTHTAILHGPSTSPRLACNHPVAIGTRNMSLSCHWMVGAQKYGSEKRVSVLVSIVERAVTYPCHGLSPRARWESVADTLGCSGLMSTSTKTVRRWVAAAVIHLCGRLLAKVCNGTFGSANTLVYRPIRCLLPIESTSG